VRLARGLFNEEARLAASTAKLTDPPHGVRTSRTDLTDHDRRRATRHLRDPLCSPCPRRPRVPFVRWACRLPRPSPRAKERIAPRRALGDW